MNHLDTSNAKMSFSQAHDVTRSRIIFLSGQGKNAIRKVRLNTSISFGDRLIEQYNNNNDHK